jgi:hypothetical protein
MEEETFKYEGPDSRHVAVLELGRLCRGLMTPYHREISMLQGLGCGQTLSNELNGSLFCY